MQALEKVLEVQRRSARAVKGQAAVGPLSRLNFLASQVSAAIFRRRLAQFSLINVQKIFALDPPIARWMMVTSRRQQQQQLQRRPPRFRAPRQEQLQLKVLAQAAQLEELMEIVNKLTKEISRLKRVGPHAGHRASKRVGPTAYGSTFGRFAPDRYSAGYYEENTPS